MIREADLLKRAQRKLGFHPRYWWKTQLYGRWPGGWGMYRKLGRYRNKDYVHERDKHPVREKHYGGEGWQDAQNDQGFHYRDYASYEEYLQHQKVKYDELLQRGMAFSPRTVMGYRRRFFSRFRYLPYYLEKDARILCAGARQGTEVEVLHDLGYHRAYGIDLNPGPENPWVKEGDFMNLEAEDHSLDLVYCNALDHVFEIDQFLREQVRVIRPDGFALYEGISGMSGEVFESIEWDSETTLLRKLLEYFGRVRKVDHDGLWTWYLLQNPVSSDV